MSSKQPISKHRTGGPHSGQSQSNQRLDYSRSNQDRMQHNKQNLRTQNSGTSHMPTVNIPTQPAPNVQASPQQQFGAFTSGQRLPPHLANNIPSAPQIPARSIRPMPRLQPNYNIRSTYPNNVSNQHFQTQQNPYYNYYTPPAQMFQIQIPNQNVFGYSNFPYMMENSSNYSRNLYQTQPPINLNSTINNNEMRQNFRQNNGHPKRERKPAIVCNDDGTKCDLEALAKRNQEKTLDKAINLDSKSLNGSNKNVANVELKLNEEKVNNATDNISNIEVKEEPICPPSIEHINQDDELPVAKLDYSTSCDNTEKLNEQDTPILAENETKSELNDLDKLADDFEHIMLENPEDSVDNVDIVEDVKSSPNNLETGETHPELPVKEAQPECETIELLPSAHQTEPPEPSLSEQPTEPVEMKPEQPENVEMIVEQNNQLEPNKLEEEIISHDEKDIHCENIASGDNNLDAELENAQLDYETPIVENENSIEEAVEAQIANDLEEGELADEEESLDNTLQNNMIYPREFLMSRREHASDYALTISNRDNIKDIVKRPSPPNSRSSEALLPDYLLKNRPQMDTQFRNKSMIQNYRRQTQPLRNYSNEKSRKIVSTSLSGTRPVDDGWRPGKLNSTNQDEIEMDTLLKNVRATLNKLTPQNYRTLLAQFKNFKIDTKDRLTKVIDLIFDKAVREPAFVVQYAGFCSELIHIVVIDKETEQNVNFKSLLIEKCQNYFYQNIYDKDKFHNLQKELEETEDLSKRKELEDLLDDEKRIERKRSVGNIKLIAELFKLRMLNTQIMFTCFNYLLNNSNEEYIECLCALITNIGQRLTETIDATKNAGQRNQFENVFNDLAAIQEQKSKLKASARIRFMILDLLDLRKNNWVPRRKVEGPKLIAQVHEDTEMQQRLKLEELKKKRVPSTPQVDEWTQVNKRKSHSGMPTKNLASLSVLKDISGNNNRLNTGNTLANFSIFKTGSHGGSTPHSQSRSSSTNYESKNQASQNDKNQRVFHDSLNAKMQSGRRDERKVSDVTNYQSDKSRNASTQSQTRSDSSDNLNDIDTDPMKFVQNINETIQEYLKSERNISDIMKKINSYCPKRKYADFIYNSILGTLEKTSQTYNPRQKWGEFLGKFFLNYCENSDIFESLKNVFAQYEDFRLDIPKFFEFIAEILAYALLTINKEDPQRKKDVVKTLVEAYNEISGSECLLFRNSLLDTIKNTKDAEKLFKEIEPLFQSDSKMKEFDKLSDILTNCLKKNNIDLNELIDQIKNSYPDKLSNENFKSALYYSLIDVAFNQTDDFNDVSNNLNKIQNVIKYFVKSQDDQVLFLIECSNFIKRMNNPSNLLNDIFSYLKSNNLFNDASFVQWSSDKRTPLITIASAQRFMDTIQRKNI